MKILITGATGFVGDAVVREALTAGHAVRVLVRGNRHWPLSQPGSLEFFPGDVTQSRTLAGCMDGMEAVIHLVGIILERGEVTFQRVHVDGVVNILAEARRFGVRRFLHMSALGTRAGACSRYQRTKWDGEEAVRGSGLDWTIFRPSVIYGPDDEFINRFAKMLRPPWRYLQFFTIPLIGGGRSRLQPIPVNNVARAFVRALTVPSSIGRTYDLCGPAPLSLSEMAHTVAEVMGKRALFIPVPFAAARLLAMVNEVVLPRPLLTRDQLLMLREDNTGDPSAAERDLGVIPPDFGTGISRYLR